VSAVIAAPCQPVPRARCGTCGDYLPHYCTCLTVITWSADVTRRIVTITDRSPVPAERAA
jgi:hypothetical protein